MRTFNTADRPLTLATSAGATRFAYDLGGLVSIADPLSQTMTRFYDAAGRLLQATDPLNAVTPSPAPCASRGAGLDAVQDAFQRYLGDLVASRKQPCAGSAFANR